MNRMYRRQRYIYDGTRRYYLLGRDQLIANLAPEAGADVLEIGCGTGRNLVHAARLYPDARFFGIDISTEMLTSAISAISRRDLTQPNSRRAWRRNGFQSAGLVRHRPVRPRHDFLQPVDDPGLAPVLEAAASRLKPGGSLHIVDFGNQERLPGIARTLLKRWLALFDVTPRDDLERELSAMAKTSGRRSEIRTPVPRLCAICRADPSAGAEDRVSGWLALLGAGLLEIAWAFGLKYSDGLTRFWPTVATLVAIALSFGLMAIALKSLPFGTAYAVWTGIGATGSIILGMLIYSEPADPVRVLCLTLIVAGMVGLKLNSPV